MLWQRLIRIISSSCSLFLNQNIFHIKYQLKLSPINYKNISNSFPLLSYYYMYKPTKELPLLQNALFHVKSVVRAISTSAISTGIEDWSVESSQHSAALCVPTEHSKRSMCRNTCAGNTFRTSCLILGQLTLLHFYQHTCEQIFNFLPLFSLFFNLILLWCFILNSKMSKFWQFNYV